MDDTVNLDQALARIRETLAADPRTRPSPAPTVILTELTENAGLKVTLMQRLKQALGPALKTVSG